MGGTDQCMDQNLGFYRIGILGKKWYLPLVTRIFDVAMQNRPGRISKSICSSDSRISDTLRFDRTDHLVQYTEEKKKKMYLKKLQLNCTNKVFCWDNSDYTKSFDEDQEEKRAWRDLQTTGWGKRGWQNLKTTWGKRTQDWQNLHSSWGKRQGWQKLHGGWGKRGWKDMQSGGWGKRFKDQPDGGQLSQFEEYLDKYEDENPNEAEKRSWDNFQGSWGKRAADWTSFRGSWGKRNPVDYMNEYSGYGDNDNYKAYIFPPGYNSYLPNFQMEYEK
ncbi:PREDICTED: allatostatins MIP [Diuraphis noxia]|uniref:allatostatins MIP n=1 Tax=Diuraphis noxia TaxID=143948 RepID=UPI000763A18E|nr:PREDICTED: allatostatins MIP [Diuraphis noxia]